jgi:hypothetical protein
MLAAVMDGDPDARHPLVERYFRAMQRGQEGEEELVALFAEDAVYVEPFSGEQAPHVGRAEIQAWAARLLGPQPAGADPAGRPGPGRRRPGGGRLDLHLAGAAGADRGR